MAKKLYVGGLPYSTTSDSLKDGFAKAGAVISASVISDKMTGRSRGFGFVEMEDADAARAIEMLDGKDFEGRKINVSEARPMAERPPRRDNGFGDRRSF
jgi:RNA recognition motif-containing protein